MDRQTFFDNLWYHYSQITPQAGRIRQLFLEASPEVINDHVAFRTFDIAPFSIQAMEPFLLELGYRRDRDYRFPNKKLRAWSYVTDDPDQPLIFFSELEVDALSPASQAIVRQAVAQGADHRSDGPRAFYAGRPWPMPTLAEYEQLAAESEYAAWLLAWGFQANHFTVSVNRLESLERLEDVVALLQSRGFELNDAGGLIKGTPADCLEQAATRADRVEVTFAGGEKQAIPSCYYEFARRYPDDSGALYRGFVAASADRIFESTDRYR